MGTPPQPNTKNHGPHVARPRWKHLDQPQSPRQDCLTGRLFTRLTDAPLRIPYKDHRLEVSIFSKQPSSTCSLITNKSTNTEPGLDCCRESPCSNRIDSTVKKIKSQLSQSNGGRPFPWYSPPRSSPWLRHLLAGRLPITGKARRGSWLRQGCAQ